MANYSEATDRSVQVEVKPLWTIPSVSLFLTDAARLNRALERILLEEESRIKAQEKGVPVAGLESGLTTHWLKYNVLNWRYPEIEEFRAYVLRGFREFCSAIGHPDDPKFKISGISCWANVLRNRQALHIHHHDPAFVSAHYTVTAGHDDTNANNDVVGDSGHTIYYRPGFFDRSHGEEGLSVSSPWDHEWRIDSRPTAGRLIFFPSYVRHEVRPYSGDSYRISIAMDVFVKMQEYPIHFGGPRWFVPHAEGESGGKRL